MTGFRVDMSPLVNSSANMGNAYRGIGQSLGGALQTAGNAYARSQQQEQEQQQLLQQQSAQSALNDLKGRAMQGDPEAFQQLMTQSPPDAQEVAQYLQQKMTFDQGQTDRSAAEMDATTRSANQNTIKKIYAIQNLDPEFQDEAYEELIKDKTDSFDASDLKLLADRKNLRAEAVYYFGEDEANAMFGGGDGKGFDVQSSKILEDGSIVAISNKGVRQVTSPTGEVITGEEAKEAVKNSNKLSHQRKVELKRLDQTIKKTQLDDSLLNDQQKGIQRSNIQRLSTLSNTSSGRESAIKKATKFKQALSSGEALSGAGRKAATYVPGVFTSQGQFDEEFNAFSEVAARQQLKASGETRPTDADVQGMKQAMFGIGRDEKVNVQLLEDFIADQIKQNEELDQLILAGHSGDLSNFTYLPGASKDSGGDVSDLSDEDLFN